MRRVRGRPGAAHKVALPHDLSHVTTLTAQRSSRFAETVTALRHPTIASSLAERVAVLGGDRNALSVYRLRMAPADGPVVLFGHAGGLAAGCYIPLLERLTRAAEVYAFDARGHGGSAAPRQGQGAAALYAPDCFARDLAAVALAVATRADRPIVFVGHSLGAVSLLRLGTHHPQLFAGVPWRRFVLFEPPLFPTSDVAAYGEASKKNRALARRTLARRARWQSPGAFADFLAERRPFAAFERAWLDHHARSTLQPAAEGDWTLACEPEVEATIYSSFGEPSTFAALGRFVPADIVHLIAGDPDAGPERDWVTAVAPEAARRLGAGRMSILAGRGHFMIQEAPNDALKLIRESF